ncbi:hypothetical protein AZI12_08170 [Levilactobacillus brevis]|nr:hypothetical protein AZI12_08170 [Levilactobacillus brevis]
MKIKAGRMVAAILFSTVVLFPAKGNASDKINQGASTNSSVKYTAKTTGTTSDEIDDWMPDKNLQQAVADKLKTTVKDLTSKKMADLTELNIDHGTITDFKGIGQATNLASLDIRNTDLSQTQNLAELGKLTKLTSASLVNDNISDVSFAKDNQLNSLTTLNMSGNEFTTLDSLADVQLPALETVDFSNNKISDVKGLVTKDSSERFPKLEKIVASGNQLTNLNSLKGSHFLNLTTLDVSHNHINDISIIRDVNVPKLSTLVAANNDISDISPIAESKLTELSDLDASYNKISNVDAFAKSSFTKLETLKVDHNQISNINVMKGLKDRYPNLHVYNVANNNINDISFMAGYELSSNTDATGQKYTSTITLEKPTQIGSRTYKILVPITSLNYEYQNGYYVGSPDPQADSLAVKATAPTNGTLAYEKFSGESLPLDGNSNDGIKYFTLNVTSATSLPDELDYQWKGAQGRFEGSGVIKINWTTPGQQGGGTSNPDVTELTRYGSVEKGSIIQATKHIYTYQKMMFNPKQRVTSYANKARVNRPMFKVLKIEKNSNGRVRFFVKDVTHTKTDGQTGYVTANTQYVLPAYYQSVPQQITVLAPAGVNAYQAKNLSGKVKHYRQGEVLQVKGIVDYQKTTRFELSDGSYVTANRNLVKFGKQPFAETIRLKQKVKVYRDANLTKLTSKKAVIKKGTKLTIQRLVYSNADDVSKKGTKRYLVNGGYITGNRYFRQVLTMK